MTSSARSPQARRRFLLISLSALLIAGCGGGGGRPRPLPSGVQAKYQVALLVPLTGEDSQVGHSIANAARLALIDMNNSSIDLSVYNTSEGGAAAAAGLALKNGARLILGPLLSDQVRAVAPLARRARVPVIAYTNDVSAAGNGVFILGFVPGQSIERVVFHARQNGTVRFGAIAPGSVYGQRSIQSYLSSVQGVGGQLVAVETYAPGQARAAARRLNSRGGFDAVLIADTGRVAMSAAPEFRSGTRLLGTDLWAGEPKLGSVARLRGGLYAAAPDSRFRQLVTRYRARFGSTPVRLASLGYDSMLLTISSAKHWDPRRRFPVDVLTYPEGFVGVDGVFRFGRDGVAQRGLEVRQVTASGPSVVSPAPSSFTR
jgi:branched-chain amino acid transport system substrate-binding protein